MSKSNILKTNKRSENLQRHHLDKMYFYKLTRLYIFRSFRNIFKSYLSHSIYISIIKYFTVSTFSTVNEPCFRLRIFSSALTIPNQQLYLFQSHIESNCTESKQILQTQVTFSWKFFLPKQVPGYLLWDLIVIKVTGQVIFNEMNLKLYFL